MLGSVKFYRNRFSTETRMTTLAKEWLDEIVRDRIEAAFKNNVPSIGGETIVTVSIPGLVPDSGIEAVEFAKACKKLLKPLGYAMSPALDPRKLTISW